VVVEEEETAAQFQMFPDFHPDPVLQSKFSPPGHHGEEDVDPCPMLPALHMEDVLLHNHVALLDALWLERNNLC